MIIYIDVLLFFIFIGVVIGFTIWKAVTDKILIKKYREEKDEGRKGEERREFYIQRAKERGTTEEFDDAKFITSGPTQFEKRGISLATTTELGRKKGNGFGKHSKLLKFFRRKKRIDGQQEKK